MNYDINTALQKHPCLKLLCRKFTGCHGFTSFCYYGGEVLITLTGIYFSLYLYICVIYFYLFIYFVLEMCVEILKSWQACVGFILGVFISSILIWTTTRKKNALIHCILSNCLLRGGHFLDSGSLPGCSPYYSASMQWLSPCTPTLPCKNSFSSSAGKTPCPFTLDYCVHLLHWQQVCFPLPCCKRDEIVQT